MEKSNELIDLIKTVPIFLDLKSFQLAKLATATTIIDLEPGTTIINEGDSLDYTYIILEGDLLAQICIPSYGNVENSHLGPLDMCGWSALTPIVRQRTGTVTAVTFCRLLKMDSRLLIPICEEDHDIGFCIYKRAANVAATSFLPTRLLMMNIIVKDNHPDLN